jgi:Cu(I)/Ag(I) efflux system protein CusF
MKSISKLTLAAAIALASATLANAAPTAAEQAKAGAATSMTEGEIKKVDKDAGKITIKHGELKNLDMPAMTMVFRVKDPSMLEQMKSGDKVSFVAEKVNGQFTVILIETKQ